MPALVAMRFLVPACLALPLSVSARLSPLRAPANGASTGRAAGAASGSGSRPVVLAFWVAVVLAWAAAVAPP